VGSKIEDVQNNTKDIKEEIERSEEEEMRGFPSWLS